MWRLGVAAVVFLAACSGDSGPDSGAQLACSEFVDVAADYAGGLMTEDELRSSLQSIESDASASDEPGIAENARRMLAAATAGDDAELVDSVGAFDAACVRAAGD